MKHLWTMVDWRPDKLLSMNDRQHRMATARIVAVWRKAVWARALVSGRPRITGVATVQLDIGTTRPNQHRDPSNAMTTAKVVIDGLTDAKFWRDDDSKHVTVLEPRFTRDIPATHYRVTITWEDPE